MATRHWLFSSPPAEPETTGRLIFQHAQRNSELYFLLLSSHGSSNLLQRVHDVGKRGILNSVKPKTASPIPIEVAANHIIASVFALIEWWLENDMLYPPTKMGEIYGELIVKPTQNIAFESQDKQGEGTQP